jgi:alkyl sulfatase BDS1-like metallo-beta-lactamase superfamily hydrolase
LGGRTGRRHGDLDAADADANQRTDLEELEPDGAASRLREVGIVEADAEYEGKSDVALELTRQTWARILLHQKTLPEAIKDGEVRVQGRPEDVTELFAAFNVEAGSTPNSAALYN